MKMPKPVSLTMLCPRCRGTVVAQAPKTREIEVTCPKCKVAFAHYVPME